MEKAKREPVVRETIIVEVSQAMKAELQRRSNAEFTTMSALVRRAITAMYMPMPQATTSTGQEVER